MKFPSVIVGSLIIGITAVLQHFLLNIGEFHLNELIAPVVFAALTAAIKAGQEWNPQPSAAARGMGEAQDSYWQRVIYK